MKRISYSGCRFPPEIIQQAIWLYLRFTLSLRDVEDLLAERGITVSYECVRRWVIHFGADDRRGLGQTPSQSSHELALDEVLTGIGMLRVNSPDALTT
jgi:putative transposase